jgi:cell division protein FtsX
MPGVESAEPRAQAPSEAELLVTIRGCQGDVVDLEIFMNVTASQAEIDGATRAVAAEPGLTVARVLGKDDAYAEFRRVFASNPDLLNSIRPTDLPASIRVLAPGGVTAEVLNRLRTLPGVETVVTTDALCAPIRALLARGITPEALARLMAEYAGGLPA